jgi:hypothetical protein
MTVFRSASTAVALTLCGVLLLAAPSAASAGTIEGVVTDDAATPNPIPGTEVCALPDPPIVESRCTTANGSGYYAIFNLAVSDYRILFSPPAGQNLTVQYHDDAEKFSDADLVPLADGEFVSGIDAELHEGGMITGTVTEAGTGNPIPGLLVCANSFELSGRCGWTDAAGNYVITGLSEDSNYQVEFNFYAPFQDNLNYLTQYYQGSEDHNDWDPVAVTVGDTTEGIDAVMRPGAQIVGRVLEVGTSAPLPKIEVCALDPTGTPLAEEFERCTFTDATGHYAIRSLRAGTFIVVFSRELNLDSDGFFPQWFDGASSAAGATQITISPPQTRTGVDARLLSMLDPWHRSPRVVVSLLETTPAKPKPKPTKCKKGFRRKKVKGKVRCVKVHKKRNKHRHRRGRGSRAKR